ncbi:MAG: hypothetical protein U0Q18_37090 [Bryobacteraceae bacterium]
MLDLSRLKPVGENTLTGLLTTAFPVAHLSAVLAGIADGSYGLIVDGLDEGRLKTTAKGFEAFLDDVIRRCGAGTGTNVVLLGRTQIVEECWEYLASKNVDAGLVTIAPFDIDSARNYIDEMSGGPGSGYANEYRDVRDRILDILGAAFTDKGSSPGDSFLSFIGYPPVLDAIVTLLKGHPNYHRIRQDIQTPSSGDLEVELLWQITSFILRREKDQKILPLFVNSIIEGLPRDARLSEQKKAFEPEEQCERLVALCLKKPISLNVLSDPALNEKYEEGLQSWLREHPFLVNGEFRNAVFESAALATLIASGRSDARELAMTYGHSRKRQYHFVYFLARLVGDQPVPISALDVLLASALEFRSTSMNVEIHVEGPDSDDMWFGLGNPTEIQIAIEVAILDKGRNQLRVFNFTSEVRGTDSVRLRGRVSSSYVSLPCELVLYGAGHGAIGTSGDFRGTDFPEVPDACAAALDQ